jgi:hypothetical protein
MNSAKLHHFVPQFYLRRFADENGRLWAWDKQTDRVFQTAPASIAAGTQFYRLTQYEADGHDPLTMEKQLSDLEGQVALITNDWLARLEDAVPLEALPIPTVSRRIIALHLAIQFLRTADTREILSALMEFYRGKPVSAAELREVHTELLWNENLIEALAERFRRSIWIFARNHTATPFITSDNPIAFRTGDNRRWQRGGIFARETYLVYPLSPHAVLYCHPHEGKFRNLARFNNCVSPVAMNEEMVQSENSGQVFMASRFIFSKHGAFETEMAFATTIGTHILAPKASD